MGGKIEAYLDCVSPYSYFALLFLLRNSDILKSHGVEIDFIPVFLGGIMVGSENTPPWKNQNKAKYSTYDSKRAQKYFGVNFETPPFFPILSLLPQRAITFIKSSYPQSKFEDTFCDLWKAMWENHDDLSKPKKMIDLLSKRFEPDDVKKIMEGANKPEIKQELNEKTKQALDSGAFGCPWFEVTNTNGKKEPFFGSDRFHFMFDFLGLPWQDIAIKEKPNL
ncbi:thioredoxin-like protein [Tothia fuscella]|uniref:Glutathione S-transferase kappa n=1 Tax=Tothia fuscella TaxID=1048955 RepID=A0A9P4NQP5_9PEZI|nr:thioredoxin-like protein [Tothia fuscella]